MEGDIGGTGLGKVRNNAIHRLDHQVDIDRGGHTMLAQCFTDQRTDGQVGDIMVVHNIEVHNIGTGL